MNLIDSINAIILKEGLTDGSKRKNKKDIRGT